MVIVRLLAQNIAETLGVPHNIKGLMQINRLLGV